MNQNRPHKPAYLLITQETNQNRAWAAIGESSTKKVWKALACHPITLPKEKIFPFMQAMFGIPTKENDVICEIPSQKPLPEKISYAWIENLWEKTENS